MKRTLQRSLYLFLRYLMIALLCLMTIILAEAAPMILYPVLGLFYLVAVLYFVIFTSWHEGGKDIALVNAGASKKNLGRGFLAFIPVAVLLVAVAVARIIAVPFGDVSGFSLSQGILPMFDTLLMMPDWYLANLPELFGANTVFWRYFIHFALLAVYWVSSGIAYIVGYKRILIIKPWLDKWKKN